MRRPARRRSSWALISPSRALQSMTLFLSLTAVRSSKRFSRLATTWRITRLFGRVRLICSSVRAALVVSERATAFTWSRGRERSVLTIMARPRSLELPCLSWRSALNFWGRFFAVFEMANCFFLNVYPFLGW